MAGDKTELARLRERMVLFSGFERPLARSLRQAREQQIRSSLSLYGRRRREDREDDRQDR